MDKMDKKNFCKDILEDVEAILAERNYLENSIDSIEKSITTDLREPLNYMIQHVVWLEDKLRNELKQITMGFTPKQKAQFEQEMGFTPNEPNLPIDIKEVKDTIQSTGLEIGRNWNKKGEAFYIPVCTIVMDNGLHKKKIPFDADATIHGNTLYFKTRHKYTCRDLKDCCSFYVYYSKRLVAQSHPQWNDIK